MPDSLRDLRPVMLEKVDLTLPEEMIVAYRQSHRVPLLFGPECWKACRPANISDKLKAARHLATATHTDVLMDRCSARSAGSDLQCADVAGHVGEHINPQSRVGQALLSVC